MALVWKFEVLFCRAGSDAPATERMEVCAESAEKAVERVKAVAGELRSFDAQKIHAVIDWGKPAFNSEESAEYLCRGEWGIYDLMRAGDLPKPPKHSRVLYTRRILDGYIERRLSGATQEEAA
jgi:hypothetical protein